MNFTKAINCGFLIDGTGREPVENCTVLVEGQNIVAVGPKSKVSVPSGTQVIDAADKTVMPGMIDAHVHLSDTREPDGMGIPRGVVLLNVLRTPPSLLVLYGVRNARLALDAGFTTVRDLGYWMTDWEMVSVRKGIEMGFVQGARVVTAGRWLTPSAGHLDLSLTVKTLTPRTVNGVDECRKAVRENVRQGVDLIKVSSSGGVIGEGESIHWRNFSVEELKVIVDESHAYGKKVASHASGIGGIRNALIAGVDTIEHGTYMDDEALNMLIQKGATLVPTLGSINATPPADAGADVMEKFKQGVDAHINCFKKAHEAGAKIAMGTDRYPSFGRHAAELELYVKYGMSEMEAILTATKTAGEALGLENRIGTIEKGKFADLVIVDGSPLKDIKILQDKKRIMKIMKAGDIVVNREGKA